MSKNVFWAAVVSLLSTGTGCGSTAAEESPITPGAGASSAGSAADTPTDTGAPDGIPPDNGRRPSTSFGDPLPGLGTDEAARFEAGKIEFTADEEADEGLGPVFNDTSCVRCHSVPATGGGSARLEARFGTVTGGQFDPMTYLGGTLRQENGIGPVQDCNYTGEVVPPEATISSQRRATPLFGLGLVDAVSEDTFHEIAQREASSWPREAGRVAIVHDIANDREAVGRFGWKNQVPTLHQFAGDAYLNEMGITTPDFPDENCPQGDCTLLRCNPLPGVNDDGSGVTAFADFMTFLAPPPRGRPITRDVFQGQKLFATTGCIHCHTPTLMTGPSASPAFDRVEFHPYSDFLLHEMGSLGDGIPLGGAQGNEFRTAPLWGVRAMTSFLHDGRASTLADAVLAHDGQARRARDRFAALDPSDQSTLIEFLNSL